MNEKLLVTDQGESIFTLRLNKEESIGLAVTTTDKSYFILDSGEYWYDAIQSKYPSNLRCRCKCNTFTAKCIYYQRIDSTDYRQVDLVTLCTSCKTEKTQLVFSIDYSPTEQLNEKPLIFCPKPNIKYKVSEITSLWTRNDATDFIRFMDSMDVKMTIWYFLGQKRVLSEVGLEEALHIVDKEKYLKIFFSEKSLHLNCFENETGVYVENDAWRRKELIQLGSPYNMQYSRDRIGFLYYVKFCNEFIDDYQVKSKSHNFEEITDKMVIWLKSNFYAGRGKNCADNKNEFSRLFGERDT